MTCANFEAAAPYPQARCRHSKHGGSRMQCQLTFSIYGTRAHPFTQHLLQLQCHSQGGKASREGIESARICDHCIRGARGRMGKKTQAVRQPDSGNLWPLLRALPDLIKSCLCHFHVAMSMLQMPPMPPDGFCCRKQLRTDSVMTVSCRLSSSRKEKMER